MNPMRYTRLAAALSLLFLLSGCKQEGFINKTKYQGEKVDNYCQDFEEEVNSLVEANKGMSFLRVSEYDNSQFDYFYLEPGQMEQVGDTLFFRLINDINYERFLDDDVAVQVRAEYRAQDHLKDLEKDPEGKFDVLTIDKAYWEENNEPFFVYKLPVSEKLNGKQLSLYFSIVEMDDGQVDEIFCNTVEEPLGPLDPPCCTSEPWQDTKPRSVVKVPELEIDPEKYRHEGFTGTLDLIFPMNSVKYDKDELNNVILNYIGKYEKEGFKVDAINMTGYASQGGTTQYNQNLSEARSREVYEDLVAHLEEMGKDTTLPITHEGRGEDWERFNLLVKTAVFSEEERQTLLDISNSAMGPDEKEAELRKIPFWQKLIDEVLVYCRHVYIEFTFKYDEDKMYTDMYPSTMPVISPELYNVATKEMTVTRFKRGETDPQKNLGVLNTLIDNRGNERANLFAMRSTYHFALDNTKNAITDIENALEQKPDNLQYGLAALSYKTKFADDYSMQERMDMLNQYNSFTMKYPDNTTLQFNRLVMMDKVGYISGALAEYDGLLSKEGKSAALLNNRGVARLKTNRIVEATADFNEAIKLDPKQAEAYFNLGVVNAYQGYPEKTVNMLKKAVELDASLKDGIFRNPVFDVVKSNPSFQQAFR